MKFKSHIPKYYMLRVFAIVFTIITILTLNTSLVYASSGIDAGVQAVVGAVYNGTSSSTQGGTSHIVNGVSYTRTGYLCYLLTKDGSTTSYPPYAFRSPGYNEISGSRWVCTSRRGQSVSGWSGDAFWGVTPWGEGGSPSNEGKIRDWMLQPINGKPQAQQFVLDCWGVEAEKSFSSDEYILVIETIMNFQYSKAGGDSGGGLPLVISPSQAKSITLAAQKEAQKYVNNIPDNVWRNIQAEEGKSITEIKKQWVNEITKRAVNEIIAKMQSEGGSNRTFTSDPLIGTVPNLIKYKNGAKVFDSYTNKVAPHAEKIKVSEAGFTAYPSSGPAQLTDAEVQSYGVAMLIIHCKNDAIHTYNGVDSPGPPEDRLPGKTGTCNIVKGYYKENLTTGAKESLGVYHELEVTSNIIVSGEPEFELVEYYCLTAI